MSVVWKINDTECGPGLGLRNVLLRRSNQVADELLFTQDGAACDGAAHYAVGDEIVLTCTIDAGSPVVWFRGRLRGLPRAGEPTSERLAYRARGAWEQLERRAYLQTWKEASDASDPDSALVDVRRGVVILGQDNTGAKVAVDSAVEDIVQNAIDAGASLAIGTIDLGTLTVPWDEVVDLSCAEAISRLLQWVPDAVVWFDYTVNPPSFNARRRADLTAVNLLTIPSTGPEPATTYAPLTHVRLNPRHDLLVSNVALIYVATNRANESSWVTTARDVYPPGTTGREDGALVRTVQLAGSIYASTVLEQRITTEVIPSALAFGTGPLTSGTDFDTVKAFWRKHHPLLQRANITIRAFTKGARTTQDPDDTLDALCNRELLSGAITDWMEDNQAVHTQQQKVTADILVEIADPDDATRIEKQLIQASAVITATSASLSLYTFLADDSYTPGEAVPTGIATVLHGALSTLQWDGAITLTEAEVSGLVSVGHSVNLTGTLAAWATMKALVQQVEYDLDAGQTAVSLGPPSQLGPDDLVELYRVNRTRRPVASHLIRTSGKSGGTQARQSLSKHHPVKPGSGTQPAPGRVFNQSLTMAGGEPTPAEIVTGLAACYDTGGAAAGLTPATGDCVNFYHSGAFACRVWITATDPRNAATDGVEAVAFTFG